MNIKVVQFQVIDGYFYCLTDDGQLWYQHPYWLGDEPRAWRKLPGPLDKPGNPNPAPLRDRAGNIDQ